MASDPHTHLLDRDAVMREYGIGERGANRIFTALPTVIIPGYRRVFVWREQVDSYLRSHTAIRRRNETES